MRFNNFFPKINMNNLFKMPNGSVYFLVSSLFLLIDFSVRLGLAMESSGGFMDPWPIGPYEKMIGMIADYFTIPSIIILVLVLLSFFVYPFLLYKDKRSLAKSIWIISWGLLILLFISFETIPSIARMLVH